MTEQTPTKAQDAIDDLTAIVNGSTDVKHDAHVWLRRHGMLAIEALTLLDLVQRGEVKALAREPTRAMWAAMGNAAVAFIKTAHHDVVSGAIYGNGWDAAPSTPTTRNGEGERA